MSHYLPDSAEFLLTYYYSVLKLTDSGWLPTESQRGNMQVMAGINMFPGLFILLTLGSKVALFCCQIISLNALLRLASWEINVFLIMDVSLCPRLVVVVVVIGWWPSSIISYKAWTRCQIQYNLHKRTEDNIAAFREEWNYRVKLLLNLFKLLIFIFNILDLFLLWTLKGSPWKLSLKGFKSWLRVLDTR